MALFGNGHDTVARAKVLELESALAELRKQFRTLRDEVHEDMERAERSRRAEAARTRRAVAPEAANQGRGVASDAPGTPLPPAVPAWGARARRLARLDARRARVGIDEMPEMTNGVHP